MQKVPRIGIYRKSDDNAICIEFRGRFCHMCGVFDYFEDSVYGLKAWGITASIRGWTKLDDETY